MRYKLLGKSLGTMTFGSDCDWGADRDKSKKQVDLFAEVYGNFIDTANFIYQWV